MRDVTNRPKGRRWAGVVFAAGVGLASPATGWTAEPTCGPHQHVVVEKDEEEGSVARRCVCDEGWDADGPAPPCRKKGGAPKKGGGESGDKPGKAGEPKAPPASK